MPKLTQTDMSCGVYMLEELGAHNHVLLRRVMQGYKRQASRNHRRHGFAQVVFSDAPHTEWRGHDGLGRFEEVLNAERFVAYLKKKFPKTEIVQLKATSPVTGHEITTYIWNVPRSIIRLPEYGKCVAKEHDRPWRGARND